MAFAKAPCRFLRLLPFLLVALSAPAQTILREYWLGIPGNTVASLTNAVGFPNSPTGRETPSSFEGPTNWSDNYGSRIRGFVTPTTSGNHTFFIAGDNQCELWLSTNDNPANKRLIARVLTYTGSRVWQESRDGNSAAQKSAPINLTAGARYYIEALQKDDIGNDCLAVGWQLPSGGFERPIPGARLRPFQLSTNAPSITQEPDDASVFEGQEVRFSVFAEGMEPMEYVWQRDGQELSVERSATLIIPFANRSEDGAKYRCVITNPKGQVITREAALTVRAEVTAPAIAFRAPILGATVRFLSQVELTFSEPVSGVNASDLLIANFPATNVTGSAAGPYLFTFPTPPAGAITVAFAADHGIKDLSENENPFPGGSWTINVNPDLATPEIRINEIVASNETGLLDDDGEPQDWIELENFGATTVNLNGWSVSDDNDNSALWIFPNVSINAGQRLIIFASGKDRRVTGKPLHANFLLGEDGEFLGLYDAASPRNLIDSLDPYPEQRVNHSYGRDSTGAWKYFQAPTPNAANGDSDILGILPPPHFSSERGFFASAFQVHLTTDVPGAEIRYTRNGGDPSGVAGILYANPLQIAATTVLRASVWKTNYLPSFPKTHTYLYNVTAARRSLPSMSLVTATNNLTGPTGIIGISGGTYSDSVWRPLTTNDYHNPSKHGIAWERPTSVEFFYPTNEAQFQADCGIRVQGSDYMRPRYTPSSKFSYRLYFRGDYGPGQLRFPIFPNGAPFYDQLVLRAGHNDGVNPFIKDELMRRLFLETGQVGARGNFVILYLNGLYKGYYNVTERIEEHFLRAWHGGNEEWDVMEQGNTALDGDSANFNSMVNFFKTQSMANPANYLEGSRRLDYTNFIDYLLVNIYGANGDWPHNNWRAARERSANGIWRFYMWDAEFALGSYNRPVTWDTFANELIRTEEIPSIYKRLRESPEFLLLFADRINKHFYNGGGLTDTNILRHFTSLRTEMSQIISGFDTFIQTTWIPQRRRVITNHFALYNVAAAAGAPLFSQHGGRTPSGFQLNITSAAMPGSTIYYTTNGADPRVLFTSGVSPSAKAFVAGQPVTLTENSHVKARVLTASNTWTALTEATFEVSEFGAPIRFTEVNYNPPGGDAYEFIELKNFSPTRINLSGFSMDGVTFRFPENSFAEPGEVIVLASDENPTAFANRYPNAIVTGYFENSLSNGGERLSLLDRAGYIVAWVDYQDSAGWPPEADGIGYTLDLANREFDPNTPASWRKSSNLYGSPGFYVEATATAALRLSEIFPASGVPGWIELHNPGATPINIANFSLGDTVSPRRLIFPNATIDAGGFYITNFNVSSSGGSLFLYDAITNRIDAVNFGRQITNSTLARVDGIWGLGVPTPNTANIAAQLASPASLIVNEWLANAAPGADDWLELHNNSDLPAALQGMTLSVSNAICRLPTLSFLPPRGYIQLFASEKTLLNHLSFKLPASGAQIRLYDPSGQLVSSVNYSTQTEGLSEGRYPDASASITKFRGSMSPGAANYIINLASPLVLNEFMARNSRSVIDPFGGSADWLELYNSGSAISLDGLSLSDNRDEPAQWNFPPGLTIESNAFLIVWFDPTHLATTNAPFNTGRALSAESGGIYLFNAQGQVLDQVEYGFQPPDLTMGRFAASWTLTAQPTPGATNAPLASLSLISNLRINEWSVGSNTERAWIEIHNPTSQPIFLGSASLTDDLTLLGIKKFVFPQFSYIGPREFLRINSSDNPGAGELNFNLSGFGEAVRLYAPTSTAVDTVSYGAAPLPGAFARLPDATGIPRSNFPTPGESNYVPLDELAITRIFPAQNLVEIRNLTNEPLDLSSWTTAPSMTLQPFTSAAIPVGLLDSDFGGLIMLARTSTNQARLTFGPAESSTAYRAIRTSLGLQSVPWPREPIVINEVMYHSPDNLPEAEYIELRNAGDTPISMSNWRINGGAHFNFPQSFEAQPGEPIVLAPFDPQNPSKLDAFKARYNIPDAATILGPFRGRLGNDRDTIVLERPLRPNADGYIPHIVVDQLNYTDQIPWPVSPGGSGPALHRISTTDLGNEPLNWTAGAPTPGRAVEFREPSDRDADGLPDIWEIANGLDIYSALDAEADSDNDGISNRREFTFQTDPRDPSDVRRITLESSSVRFPVAAGETLRLEYCDDLTLGNWITETTVDPVSGDRLVSIPIAKTASLRFYRLAR